MTNQEFINYAKLKVQEWLCRDNISTDDIFVVWCCKTLQHHKALLSTRFANYYFECTFNGDKGEMYMDIYNKLDNKCFKVAD